MRLQTGPRLLSLLSRLNYFIHLLKIIVYRLHRETNYHKLPLLLEAHYGRPKVQRYKGPTRRRAVPNLRYAVFVAVNRPPTLMACTRTAKPEISSVSNNTPHTVASPSAGSSR